ncbi:MAG: aldehyde ferredoxin oxidoreductase, partial [Firmicutes bacterium]|nr:aldehyde ferredoxin oxidoreductase [Bacillota bacterium]
MEGYAGNILKIDLDNEKIYTEPLSEKLVKDYIGGRGFASRILFDSLKPGIDPFSPDNMIVVASGPLAGTLTPGAGKVTFAVKSPATGSYGDSNMGGHFIGIL